MIQIAIHTIAGVIILLEALNKLERTDLFDGKQDMRSRLCSVAWVITPWRWKRIKVVTALKATAWSGLSIGSVWSIFHPLFHVIGPSVDSTIVIASFAVLILRSRLKESHHGETCE